MTAEKDNTPTLDAAAAAAAADKVATPAKPTGKRKLTNITAGTGDFKYYQSTEKHSYPFDIQIAGEVINGQWSKADGFVEFAVPPHLVEGFEKHYHFVSGNLAAAE